MSEPEEVDLEEEIDLTIPEPEPKSKVSGPSWFEADESYRPFCEPDGATGSSGDEISALENPGMQAPDLHPSHQPEVEGQVPHQTE